MPVFTEEYLLLSATPNTMEVPSQDKEFPLGLSRVPECGEPVLHAEGVLTPHQG